MNKKPLFTAFAVCLIYLNGCSSDSIRVVDAYHGSKLPLSQLAILYTPQKNPTQKNKPVALLAGVNGKNYAGYVDGYPMISKVLPGKVTIKVLCSEDYLSKFLIFQTRLKAGHFYELSCDLRNASDKDHGTDNASVRKLMRKAAKQ